MIYKAIEAARLSSRPLFHILDTGQKLARHEKNPLRDTLPMRALAAAWELPSRQLKTYDKPTYDVREKLGDEEVPIHPELIQSLPFADLLRFTPDDRRDRPKVLIVAALSGHFATLLQDTIRGFARDFDTYITDWKDARQVPLADGDFGLDDYTSYIMQFLETLGPGTHVVATCQAAPPAMVATAVMEAQGAPCAPAVRLGPPRPAEGARSPPGRGPSRLGPRGRRSSSLRGSTAAGASLRPSVSPL